MHRNRAQLGEVPGRGPSLASPNTADATTRGCLRESLLHLLNLTCSLQKLTAGASKRGWLQSVCTQSKECLFNQDVGITYSGSLCGEL